MGWCGGTEIFDAVVGDVLKEKSKEEIIKNLLDALTDNDWDNVDESFYFDHPIVLKVIKETFPHWYEEEN